jgi:spermidine synthase
MERNYGLEEKINAEEFYEETATSSEVSSKYPLVSVLWAGSTPFCKEVVIAKSEEYGRMLFTDGELQSTEMRQFTMNIWSIRLSLRTEVCTVASH